MKKAPILVDFNEMIEYNLVLLFQLDCKKGLYGNVFHLY